ncbi:MAG: hypothetical protein ABR875_03670 [Minisyncoccia bacterium]
MDKNRRKFLKILLIGSGTFLVVRIFGPLFSKFLNTSLAKNEPLQHIGDNNSTAFRVVNGQKSFSVYDESGEEILQIDKGE